jgi:hypothetical protein
MAVRIAKTTFPITLRANVSAEAQQSPQPETYVVCLECGHHFAYDWTTMASPSSRSRGPEVAALVRISDKHDLSHGKRLLSTVVRCSALIYRRRDPKAERGLWTKGFLPRKSLNGRRDRLLAT